MGFIFNLPSLQTANATAAFFGLCGILVGALYLVASYGLLGMIHWVVRWYHPHGRLDQDQVVAQLTHLALQGVFADYPGVRS